MTKEEREQKARIFAKYMGSKMILPKSGRIETLIGVNMDPFELNDGGSFMTYDYFPFKLILKDLSDISDEDAIEVAKMLKVDYNNKEYSDAHFDLSGISDWVVELFITETGLHYSSGYQYAECIDFLRSRGYALPYKGQDLFEAGIAIVKTNSPTPCPASEEVNNTGCSS